jgi:IS30 family transposase
MAERRRTRQAKLREHVVARLRDGWSPQQIAGQLKLDGHSQGRVSHETIYRHVYSKGGREGALFGLLAMARRQRRRRFGRKPRVKAIPPSRCISERPTHIERREEFGHWESDLVVFARRSGGANLTSLQERKSRFLMLIGNEDKRAATVGKGIGGVLGALPASHSTAALSS